MKMKRTQSGSGGELVEIRLVGVMSIQKPDHVCDSFVIVHAVSLSWAEIRDHPLLATIFKSFARPANWSTPTNHLTELAGERFTGFIIVLITPDDDLEDLRADVAPALESSPQPSARRPILRFSRRDIFVGRTRVPITIKNVERNAAIIESVGP